MTWLYYAGTAILLYLLVLLWCWNAVRGWHQQATHWRVMYEIASAKRERAEADVATLRAMLAAPTGPRWGRISRPASTVDDLLGHTVPDPEI